MVFEQKELHYRRKCCQQPLGERQGHFKVLILERHHITSYNSGFISLEESLEMFWLITYNLLYVPVGLIISFFLIPFLF